jgi:hypothetical protein
MTKNPAVYALLGLAVATATVVPFAHAAAPVPSNAGALPPVVRLTAAQDHDRLAQLLGVTDIRRGADGQMSQVNNGNFAPYDESKANDYKNLPDIMTTNDGRKVTSADMWWNVRRPEIVELMDREMYGRMPKVTPKVTWEVTSTAAGTNTIVPTVVKQIVGHVDNSAYPLISVNIQLSLTVPANALGPVPVIMVFGGGFGGGGFGGRGGAGRGTAPAGAPGAAPGAPAPGRGPGALAPALSDDTFFVAAPAGPAAPGATGPAGTGRGAGRGFGGGAGGFGGGGGFGAGGAGPGGAAGGRGGGIGGGFGGGAGLSTENQILARGWAYATLNPGTIQADNGNGLTEGIIGLVNRGQPRKPDDWGALRAWAWGVSRAIDYFETDPLVDAKQVGLEGHSRYGKGTIVAMAYEPRLAIAYPSSSGEGGAHINRRRFGEKVENVGGTQEYHWMAGNFIKYTGTVNGKILGPDDLPVDGHDLVAMCAPRPVFISGGIQQSDAWQDPKGMFMAGALASPVYELLGRHGTGVIVNGKFQPIMEFPTPMTAIMDGDVAFREHEQGHTDGPNWPYFLQFASRYLHLPATPPPGLHKVPAQYGVDWEYTRPPSPVPPATPNQ